MALVNNSISALALAIMERDVSMLIVVKKIRDFLNMVLPPFN